jgi:hypothetical protein
VPISKEQRTELLVKATEMTKAATGAALTLTGAVPDLSVSERAVIYTLGELQHVLQLTWNQCFKTGFNENCLDQLRAWIRDNGGNTDAD